MSLLENILHAASVLSSNLSNVDPQDLLPHHRDRLQSAFQILEQTLSSPSLRSTQHHESTQLVEPMLDLPEVTAIPQSERRLAISEAQRQHESSENPNAQTLSLSDLQTTLSNQDEVDQESSQPLPEQLDEVQLFMESLQRHSKKIHAFAKKDVEEAISRRSNWSGQDPRLVDIDISERRTSTSGKFRAWLGRYSFAEDYLAWVESTYRCPRNSILILNEKDADKRGQGHITEFMSLNNLPGEKAHKAIRYGLKYISFEHVYGDAGVSVLLCHMFTAFRNLSYAQFGSLAKAIRESTEWSNLAKAKSDWLRQCRLIYNEDNGRSNIASRKTRAHES